MGSFAGGRLKGVARRVLPLIPDFRLVSASFDPDREGAGSSSSAAASALRFVGRGGVSTAGSAGGSLRSSRRSVISVSNRASAASQSRSEWPSGRPSCSQRSYAISRISRSRLVIATSQCRRSRNARPPPHPRQVVHRGRPLCCGCRASWTNIPTPSSSVLAARSRSQIRLIGDVACSNSQLPTHEVTAPS